MLVFSSGDFDSLDQLLVCQVSLITSDHGSPCAFALTIIQYGWARVGLLIL